MTIEKLLNTFIELNDYEPVPMVVTDYDGTVLTDYGASNCTYIKSVGYDYEDEAEAWERLNERAVDKFSFVDGVLYATLDKE